MGYVECNITMESKIGSASSLPGCSTTGLRGQSLKSSPFCPRSSSRVTQSIIKDHMVSHYKKVYSAKAAIDASVPKSLIYSVKYNDQIRKEQLRKGGRPQSAHSLSQRNSRASCSSAQSRRSVQGEESPYFCSGSSMISTPRFNTSFHVKQIVYPSFTIGNSRSHSHHTRPASELNYRSFEATSHRQQSAYSSATTGNQNCYKTFQDPVQKTYSGDLLHRHSQHFTQDKPFTPRTLKSEKSSYLSQYRYYRAPRRKPNQDCTNPRLMRQETYHGSTQTKGYSSMEFEDPPQGFSTEHEWSEDELNGTHFSVSRQPSQANKSRHSEFFHSSSRVSPEGRKSPIMMSVSAEEEELMYLEFISDVTDDILSRGHFSDRVLDRVLKRHFEMNRHRLDEDKMRHLLEVLRKDFAEPVSTPTSSAELERKENDLLHTHIPQLESRGSKQMETKEDNNLFPYASLIKYGDLPENDVSLSVYTPLHSGSPERTASPTETNNRDSEDLNQNKGIGSPWLSEHVSEYTGADEEELHQNQTDTTVTDNEGVNQNHGYTTITSDEGFHLDHAEVNYDGLSNELEDLGRNLSESLHVSSNTHDNNQGASVSDDEF
uniref:spermatogenesis-associated protein 7 n=1 Tax=Centroberyx gerrardi TaxID=166262 RepID=UPI003AAF3613